MKFKAGSGLLVLLTIGLFLFKALGIIDLAWVWVFTPIWITPATILGFIALVFCFILLILLFVLGLLVMFSPLILVGLIVYLVKERW